MNTPEDPNAIPRVSERPTVRFRQLCKVSNDTLLAVSNEGAIYRREFNEDARESIWQRLLTVSTTELEDRLCTYPGCNPLFEVFPGGTDIPDHCRYHRNRTF